MLCYLRYPGRPLRAGESPQGPFLAFIADQIGVLPEFDKCCTFVGLITDAAPLQWAAGGQTIAEPLFEYGNVPSIRTAADDQKGFLDKWWSPQLRAQLVLADFLEFADWRTRTNPGPPPKSPEVVKVEIESLLSKASRRGTRQGEILAQSDSFVDYWYRLLMADRHRRPATVALIQVGIAVGGVVALYWKNEYKRMRPSQVFPGLMPPISIPPHASYPSGHSTQAHLIWLCVREAAPFLDEPMRKLAARIAQNREIAGVHFSSDTAAGLSLACNTFSLLSKLDRMKLPRLKKIGVLSQKLEKWQPVTAKPEQEIGVEPCRTFRDIVEAAVKEWKPFIRGQDIEIPPPLTLVDDFAGTMRRVLNAHDTDLQAINAHKQEVRAAKKKAAALNRAPKPKGSSTSTIKAG